VAAAILHAPIDDRPVERLARTGAGAGGAGS